MAAIKVHPGVRTSYKKAPDMYPNHASGDSADLTRKGDRAPHQQDTFSVILVRLGSHGSLEVIDLVSIWF